MASEVNTRTDRMHCGGCRAECDDNFLCFGGVCAFGCIEPLVACTVTDEDGETHNACYNTLSDVNHCGACGKICDTTKRKNSLAVTCKLKECVATTCEPGYYIDGGFCKDYDELNCGSKGKKCVVANADNYCEKGNCFFSCKRGFYQDETRCLPNNSKNCARKANSCEVANAEYECEAERCIYTCHTGYHRTENGCALDTKSSCGGVSVDCQKLMPGWEEGECTDRRCVATKCKKGYKLQDGKCVVFLPPPE
ncbi:MAG: hypothetical protein WC966_06655 [Bradymonadales bacterium]